MTVLFTCAGRRNYLIQYFKEIIGNGGKTIAVDSDAMAPALMEADVSFAVPSVYDDNYIPTLVGIIKDHKVDMVIPLNDLELPIMAAHKKILESTGAQMIISRSGIIDLCADKWKTYNFFEDLKIPTPKTFIGIDDTLMALAENSIDFPIVLKPRWGFGSVGVQEVESEEELRLSYQLLLAKVNKTLMASVGSDTMKNQIILQEKIEGEECGIDIVNDFDGNHHNSYARIKKAMRAGETDRAQSVVDERFSKIAKKIGKATRHIGIMDCDFFLKNDTIYFLEMNPRFGGGYPFSHQAGVHIPGMYVEWSKGNTEISKYDNYRPDLVFSKCERIVEIKSCREAGTKNVRLRV
jgi:carbamoyl-phosphate synthase large subunit